MLDWRALEAERRRTHPEIRGVYWEHNHVSDRLTNPTDSRGQSGLQRAGLHLHPIYQFTARVKSFAQRRSDGIVAWVRDAS